MSKGLGSLDCCCFRAILDRMPGKYGEVDDWRGPAPGLPGARALPFGKAGVNCAEVSSPYEELRSGRDSTALVATDVSGA